MVTRQIKAVADAMFIALAIIWVWVIGRGML